MSPRLLRLPEDTFEDGLDLASMELTMAGELFASIKVETEMRVVGHAKGMHGSGWVESRRLRVETRSQEPAARLWLRLWEKEELWSG